MVALVGCVEEALTAGLLVESGSRLTFQHGLIRQALHETTPTALRLVRDAMQFARENGYAPHPDYPKVAPLWGNVDPNQARRTFPMGHNGRPLVIKGPAELF